MVHNYRYLYRHLHTNISNNRWVVPCLVSRYEHLSRLRREGQTGKARNVRRWKPGRRGWVKYMVFKMSPVYQS